MPHTHSASFSEKRGGPTGNALASQSIKYENLHSKFNSRIVICTWNAGLEDFGIFTVEKFRQDVILNQPVDTWPTCDVLIAFYSDGFPLSKAQDYADLHRDMFVLNDIKSQNLLFDRRDVYNLLIKGGVPVPRHVFCNRGEEPKWKDSEFEEGEDHIVCDGVRINKPFVEKPVSGEDHNVYIYYNRAAGGGTKRLFRKVDNKSSDFFPDDNNVRREGSYIYEEFMTTEGTDVKVYAVGPEYAHAEARKSPVLDGVVQRSEDGKEIRYPVMLSRKQKKIAHDVVIAFKQAVCGFDLLISGGQSYVCDVNGWSFVKNSSRFWDDTARTLLDMILADRSRRMVRSRSLEDVSKLVRHRPSSRAGGDEESPQNLDGEEELLHEEHEELRCVIAVIRHGDRTPKQKMKMKIVRGGLCECFIDLLESMDDGGGGGGIGTTKERKLKTARELQLVLDTTRALLQRILAMPQPASEAERQEREDVVSHLEQMRTVLEKGGQFSGINRKVQIKPTAWTPLADVGGDSPPVVAPATPAAAEEPAAAAAGATGSLKTKRSASPKRQGPVTEALMVLKWGGNLTKMGRDQAKELGLRFRDELYPGESKGFLRLHNSYRHDLKIYSSDEGRVQMTAAAFTKSFLALEGELTPILVSLVSRDRAAHNMLDPSGVNLGKEIQEEVKATLRFILQMNKDITDEDIGATELAVVSSAILNAIKAIRNPTSALRELRVSIFRLLNEVDAHIQKQGSIMARTPSGDDTSTDWGNMIELHDGETLRLLYNRWQKLYKDLYNTKKEVFDISKIPDVYDCAKYDSIHNQRLLGFRDLEQLYHHSRRLAEFVCPSEYGMTRRQRLDIGGTICRNLLNKIVADIEGILPKMTDPHSDDESAEASLRLNKDFLDDDLAHKEIKTRLYFTSESHVHSIINSIRYAHFVQVGGLPGSPAGVGGATRAASIREDSVGSFTAASRSSTPNAAEDATGGTTAAQQHAAATAAADAAVDAADAAAAASEATAAGLSAMDLGGLGSPEGGGPKPIRGARRGSADLGGAGGVGPRGGRAARRSLMSAETCSLLNDIPEFDYLSQIVIRVYESKTLAADNPDRFRVEVGVSPGVAGNPFDTHTGDDPRTCKPLIWFRHATEHLSVQAFLGQLRGVSRHADQLSAQLQAGVGRHVLTTAAVQASESDAAT